MTGIIFLLKVRKLVKKWHTAYPIRVVDTQALRSDPSKMSIVCEYLDVFSEEMSGLPPKRWSEFTIEVIPGTTPIFQTPYRMVPSELKELKSQLEELLEKGYIWPNTSPQGAPIML